MKTPVGEVRPSQLLWTYGPGALIDLPNLSVLTMGLDRWDKNRCEPIEEARLLAAVRRVLGPQVVNLRVPPIVEGDVDPFSPEAKIGVPVLPFPRFVRCVRCGYLGELDNGLFKLKENAYRPDETHFVHSGCSKGTGSGKESDAVPARFLTACRNGHLDDFPWRWYVHDGDMTCGGNLTFFESGASLQTENLMVKCESCGKSKSMVYAFGQESEKYLPACRGRNPHLDSFDEKCGERARVVLLGATNGWFPNTLSVLAIPIETDALSQIVLDGWEDYFSTPESVDELKGILKIVIKQGKLQGLEKYAPDEIWKAIEDRRAGKKESVTSGDIKGPEWKVLTDPNPPTDWPNFLSKGVNVPVTFSKQIEKVRLIERLREVNALIGFTRVEAPEEESAPDERPPMADLCKGKPEWIPAVEVHGEGIFIQFSEHAVVAWEKMEEVKKRNEILFIGHRGWRNARRLSSEVGFPGVRYAMLHTFAHILIRELSLECGYNAASIRERIYSTTDPELPMAGVLIYTASPDSDGTLGGLVELGKPERLGPLIERALARAATCSSDPLCAEHDPGKDRSLHAASCHACGFVAETSCERGNKYLDRALIVATYGFEDSSFF